MSHFLATRIHQLAESETLAMARRSRELKAKGMDIISLNLGEPDFYTPDFVKEAAKKAIDENNSFYTPVAGTLELRQAVCAKLLRDNNLVYTPDQIVCSTGAKQAIANTILALINPGDEVIILSPYWVTYVEIVKLAGGTPIILHAGVDQDYKPKAAAIEKVITERSKLIMFSTPNNPTGAVYTHSELQDIAAIVEKNTNIFVLADEIYEHINFVGKHHSIASFSSIKERCIIINGLSKAFAMTGWRIGYLAANKEIAAAADKIQGQFTSATCAITQKAATAALLAPVSSIEKMVSTFEKRKHLAFELVAKIPNVEVNQPDGAFYLFPNVSYYIGKKYNDITIHTINELALYLLNEFHICLVSGDAFGDDKALRISYAADEKTITEGINRLQKGLLALH